MQARNRNLMLTALIGGPLFGMLLGVAANPTMTPAPEPSWRSARPDPIYSSQPQQIVDYGPQDLSPDWYVDRMPTWKRRAAEQEAAAYARMQYAAYVPEPLPSPEPEAEAEMPPPSPVKIVTWPTKTPMDEAAEARNAEREARAPAGEARAAAAESEPMVDPAAPAL